MIEPWSHPISGSEPLGPHQGAPPCDAALSSALTNLKQTERQPGLSCRLFTAFLPSFSLIINRIEVYLGEETLKIIIKNSTDI